jgi:hypothetical protein
MNELDEESNPYSPPRAELVLLDEANLIDPGDCERLPLPHLRAKSRIRIVGLGCILAAPAIIGPFYQ